MGNLFPWNSMITAAHYFSLRFCGTAVQYSFESYFSVITMLSQAIGLALVMQYLEKYPLKYCVLCPIIATTVVMIITASLVLLPVDPVTMFNISFFFCAVIGLSSAVSGGGLFGLSGCLPPKYTGALMSGQALGGIVVSICSLITIAMGTPRDMCIEENKDSESAASGQQQQVCHYDIDYSTFAFFSIAAIVLLLCILSFIALLMLPFTM
jgi:solute carrier family 29 (equilibrative nucleoside transporter), member 1/2/3